MIYVPGVQRKQLRRARRAIRKSGLPVDTREGTLPQTYTAACQALAECEALDECRDWADRAAALASYGRQAHDRSLMDLARRIQLRAVRRIGELCQQVPAAPNQYAGADGRTGRFAAAKAAGISRSQTVQALRIVRIPPPEFEAAVESATPPSPTTLADPGRAERRRHRPAEYAEDRTSETIVEKLVTTDDAPQPPHHRGQRGIDRAEYIDARYLRRALRGLVLWTRSRPNSEGGGRSNGYVGAPREQDEMTGPERIARGVMHEDWPVIEAHWTELRTWIDTFMRAPRRRDPQLSVVVDLKRESGAA